MFSFFGKIKKDRNTGSLTFNKPKTETKASTDTSFRKILKQSMSLLDATDELETSIINLSKKTGINLENHRARVCIVMDKSGSMQYNFLNGNVQNCLTRLLPLALKFDDNGELEVFLFNTICTKETPMDFNNYSNYVDVEIIQNKKGATGGTSYACAIQKIIEEYGNQNCNIPTFVIFITDGETADTLETDRLIVKTSTLPIFIHFIGVGNDDFKYLHTLDVLPGRKVDNTAFTKVLDFSKLNDDKLYDKLLEQYIPWLKSMNFVD